MTTLRIDPIVEGHGDVAAVQLLVRRIAEESDVYVVSVRHPQRVPRSQMNSDALDRAVAAHRDSDLVIVLLDGDDDDPDALRSALIERSRAASSIVAIAVKEYEAWLLAGISSLRGAGSVADDATFYEDPELPRDAKGALQQMMTEKYRETLHQAKLTAQVDLDLVAQRSPSFARFRNELQNALAIAS